MDGIISLPAPAAELFQAPAVSARALAIAREIDRLVPGEYNIYIEKHTAAEGGGMYYELAQEMKIRARELK